MRYTLIIISVLFSTSTLFAQDVETIEVADDTESENAPFSVVEKVPVYPGCTGEDNRVLKQCMSDNIAAFVGKKFNIKKTSKGLTSGTYKVFVAFKIDKNGEITAIKTRGPNKATEKEAMRVMKKLPKMIPGQQKGKNIGVLYSLPITFKIDK